MPRKLTTVGATLQSIDLVDLAPLPESDDESPGKDEPPSKVTDDKNGDTEMEEANDALASKGKNDVKGDDNEDEDEDEEGDEDDEEV